MNTWIKCEDAMPEPLQRVVAHFTNEQGKGRTEIAVHIPPKTVLAEDFLSEESWGCEEYDEEKDCVWVVEGWWESSWESDTDWKISRKVTHWMPLPQAPELVEVGDNQ